MPVSGFGPEFVAVVAGIIIGLWAGFLFSRINRWRASRKAHKTLSIEEIKKAHTKEEVKDNNHLIEGTDQPNSKEVNISNEDPSVFPSLPQFLK